MDKTQSIAEQNQALRLNQEDEFELDAVVVDGPSEDEDFLLRPSIRGASKIPDSCELSVTCSQHQSETSLEGTRTFPSVWLEDHQKRLLSLASLKDHQACVMSARILHPSQCAQPTCPHSNDLRLPPPPAYLRWSQQSRNRYLDQGRIGLPMIRPSVTYAGKPVQIIHLVNGVRKQEKRVTHARTRKQEELNKRKLNSTRL